MGTGSGGGVARKPRSSGDAVIEDFGHAVTFVIEMEGGATITDDPNDPGGLTKYGISQRAYPHEDIRALTLERAEELYRRDYWDAVRGDEMPWPLCLILFDSAVNQGPQTSIRLFQRSQKLYEDGVIGPVTMKAALKLGKRGTAAVVTARLTHYLRSSKFALYGTGWYNRCVLLAFECGSGL